MVSGPGTAVNASRSGVVLGWVRLGLVIEVEVAGLIADCVDVDASVCV